MLTIYYTNLYGDLLEHCYNVSEIINYQHTYLIIHTYIHAGEMLILTLSFLVHVLLHSGLILHPSALPSMVHTDHEKYEKPNKKSSYMCVHKVQNTCKLITSHTYTQKCNTLMHTCTRMHAHARTHAHTHTHTHTHTHHNSW